MRKYSNYIFIFLLLFSVSCSNGQEEDEDIKESASLDELHVMSPENANSNMSVYSLESSWTTAQNDVIKLDRFSDKIQIITLIYTSCEFACPRIIADLQRIEKEVTKMENSDQVHYTIVTIDPEIDTPQRLAEFAKEKKMSPATWTLLNGKEDDILELAAVLGVRYKKTTDKDYAHSNVITVLNRQGRVVHQQEGLGTEPTETLAVLKELLNSPS